MTAVHVIFYIFAVVAVGSALFVITTSNPVRSVLSLVVTFFAMAGIWMILHAEFLSLILLLVYVGAVMTLFLFVVMMLNIDRETKMGGFVRYLPFGILVMLLLTGIIFVAIGPKYFGLQDIAVPTLPENYNNTELLGMVLYTKYAYAFEVAGVILLAAIIAAITLTNRGPRKRKVQFASDQIDIRKSDRMRLVTMTAEPKQGTTT